MKKILIRLFKAILMPFALLFISLVLLFVIMTYPFYWIVTGKGYWCYADKFPNSNFLYFFIK